MEYAEARGIIKSGDLIAQTHTKWRSWHDLKVQAVRLWQRSKYSHVGTAWRMGGRIWLIEAVQPVPRLIPLRNAGDFDLVQVERPHWTRAAEDAAMRIIGHPRSEYSQWEAVEGALGLLHPGKDDLWMCAELAWVLGRLSGVDYGPSIYPAAMVDYAMAALGATVRSVKGAYRV